MRTPARNALIALTAWLAFAGTANAELDTSATIDKDIEHYVVNPDGTWSMTRQLALQINDARAVDAEAQQSLSYNRSLDTLDIVEAYTEKPDGRRVPVGPDQIREQEEAHLAGAAMFQDMRIKTVIFPQVEVGDRLLMTARMRESTPLFPGHFTKLSVPSKYGYHQVSVIVDLPATLPLYADARGYAATSLPAPAGRRLYRYDYRGHGQDGFDLRAVSYLDYGDRLALTTMQDYAELGRAYQRGVADKASATPRLIALAQSIIGDQRDPRARALALSEWVRKNVRYVAVYVGVGGLVPHPAEQVAEHRYGDCKDHAGLLEALLSAVGIDSSQALINSGTAYALPTVPGLGVLDHVITYIPALDLYLDSTAATVSAGFLPQGDLGKPTLLTKSGQLGHTPVTQINVTTVDATVTLGADGAADLVYRVSASGAAAESMRQLWRTSRPNHRNLGIDSDTVSDIEAGNVNGADLTYRARQTHHRKNFLTMSGSDALRSTAMASSLLSPLATAYAASVTLPPDLARPCNPQAFEETIRILLPSGLRLRKLPEAVSVHAQGLDFTSSYRSEAGAIVIARRYASHAERAVCTARDVTALAANYGRIIGDLVTQLTFQQR